ncbi:MAG: AAA family ATPase [Actinobacteria bacterium]|nr:AAA family ATPase [Actinomycetota bacterium]
MSVTAGDACGSCGEDLPAGARFCPACGAATSPPECASCGEPVTAGARFCPSCGSPMTAVAGPMRASDGTAPVAERRVTSVLFADLVGFTPLSEARDSEDVRELLSSYFLQCRTVIGRYGGTVEKFIGDAVMAVWGVPIAHEDDAERAVRAGLDLLQAVAGMGEDVGAPGLSMRVGVVTGEVAVTIGATAEGMVAGDAVNTAARVQSAAEPGQLWVDETSRSLTAATIAYEDTGEHVLKGKAEPMRLWRARAVVAEVGGQRVDGLEAPLAGRLRELRLLKELFHATEESMRPRLVVVDGEPGVGKSRLAWEFEKYVDGLTASARWHRGRCLAYGDGVAFWALAEAVRGRLGLVESDAGDVVGEHLGASLVQFVRDVQERDWMRPRLAALLGAGPAGSFAREDLFSAWTAFFERVGGGDEPVVLVIDDAQFADDGLLDFLDHLLTTARAGIFVVALARPELLERRRDLGGRRTTVIRLEPLDDSVMATMIDGLVSGFTGDTRDALVRRAEGIPLFAVETVRTLIDRSAVIPLDGRYVAAVGVDIDLDAVGAPASLQALVAARLDALTADERRVVADASVLGASFSREALDAVGSSAVDVEAALSSLQRKEILALQQDRFSAERGQYRFVQSVVRQVAYATQSRRDRKFRHLAAAAYLVAQPDAGNDLAVVAAQHLLDAVDASSASDDDTTALTERARSLLVVAAVRATSLGAPGDAQRMYEAALERATEPIEQAQLHTSIARVAVDAGHFEEAADHALAAIALFDGLGLEIDAADAAAALSMAYIAMKHNGAALDASESRWTRIEEMPGADNALLRLGIALSSANQARGEYGEIPRYAERMLLIAEASRDARSVVLALLAIGSRYSKIGAPLTSIAVTEGAVRISRENGLWNELARALNNLSTVYISRDLEVAFELGREGMEAARRSGVVMQVDYTTFNHLLVLWTAGRLADLAAHLADAVETVVDEGIRLCLSTVEAWLADATGRQLPELPDAGATDNESDLAWLANLALMRALANGTPEEAARIGAESLDHLIAAGGLDDDFMHLWPPLVEAALDAGDTALAERLMQPVGTAPPGLVSPAVAAQHHRLLGLLGAARGDDSQEVEANLRAGVLALDDFGAVGLRARAQQELAGWLVNQGRPDEAAPMEAQARATYAEIGATGWLAGLEARQRIEAG